MSAINERRHADSKLGTGNQIPMLFDGRAAATPSAGIGWLRRQMRAVTRAFTTKKARDGRGLTSNVYNVWTSSDFVGY